MRNAAITGGQVDLPLVLVRGAGDLASGIAIRLYRSGFPVFMTEIARPLVVRRSVAFAQAVFDGTAQVEEVRAELCTPDSIVDRIMAGVLPVVVDPHATCLHELHPPVVVDAIMAKRNTGTAPGDGSFVIALGPGFTAGVDCHAVVETNRGHNLGRVIWEGSAEANTGQPGALPGVAPGVQRALYAPSSGYVKPLAKIGDGLREGDNVATVESPDGQRNNITAAFDGVLRGLIHPTVLVTAGMKIGDIDPRIQPINCFTVSDKSLAIGGAVLEAALSAMNGGLLERSRGASAP